MVSTLQSARLTKFSYVAWNKLIFGLLRTCNSYCLFKNRKKNVRIRTFERTPVSSNVFSCRSLYWRPLWPDVHNKQFFTLTKHRHFNYINSLNNPVYAKINTFNRNADYRESYSRAEPARAFRRFVLSPLIYYTCWLADTVHQ